MTTPASYLPGANDAFAEGRFHAVNQDRANAGSITLNDTASASDQGLADTSARWNSQAGGYEPRSVLAGLPGMSGNGMSAADAQRKLPGGYTMPSANGSSQDSYQQASLLRAVYGSD